MSTRSAAEVLVKVEGYPDIVSQVGVNLLELCELEGIPMGSECGGFAGCSSCRVEVLSGADSLSARDDIEVPFLDSDTQRLGCQAIVHGAVSFRLCPGML
jgi:adenylate cyclase